MFFPGLFNFHFSRSVPTGTSVIVLGSPQACGVYFTPVIATPDMMGVIGRLGRVLGPKGLMPNPKSGTVTQDVTKAIEEIKAGKVEYRLDKTNIIHVPVGKVSFGAEKLSENFFALTH